MHTLRFLKYVQKLLQNGLELSDPATQQKGWTDSCCGQQGVPFARSCEELYLAAKPPKPQGEV